MARFKFSATALFVVAALVLSLADSSLSQEQQTSETLTAEEFEKWVKASNIKTFESKDKPIDAESALMQRLRTGKAVTDDAVIALVETWIRYEQAQWASSNRQQEVRDFCPNSRRIIGELLDFTYGRPYLRAVLHQTKAPLLAMNRERTLEMEEYEKAVQLLTPLLLDVEANWVHSTLFLGNSFDQLQKQAPVPAQPTDGLTYADTTPRVGKVPHETTIMTAEEFEKWVKASNSKTVWARDNPIDAETALMQRLRAGNQVTDDAAMTVVKSWISYESPKDRKNIRGRNEVGNLYPNSRRFIDELLAVVYGRPYLQAILHQTKAPLLKANGDAGREIEEYEKAVQLLAPLRLDIEIRRGQSTLSMAHAVYGLGDHAKADALYMEVLRYPWWKVRDAKITPLLIERYVSAGNGLINTRRNNLAALKELSFAPATEQYLGARLKEAIEQAEPPRTPAK